MIRDFNPILSIQAINPETSCCWSFVKPHSAVSSFTPTVISWALFYLAVALLITPRPFNCGWIREEGSGCAGVEPVRRSGDNQTVCLSAWLWLLSLEYCDGPSNELHFSCWLIKLRHTAQTESHLRPRMSLIKCLIFTLFVCLLLCIKA